MTRDEIIGIAREAGGRRNRVLNAMVFDRDKMLERFAELVAEAEIRRMVADGWRQCAAGQKTTQHCGLLEEAVAAERERCAKVCKSIAHDSLMQKKQTWFIAAHGCATAIMEMK